MGLFDWITGTSGGTRDNPGWGQTQKPAQPLGKLEGDGEFDFDIVGESKYQPNLLALAGAKTDAGCEILCEATLHREPRNPHDRNAIRVDVQGRTVGYIPRLDAAAIAPIMDRQGISAVLADAIIVGGWLRGSNEGHFGLKLDMPFNQIS